MTEVLPFFIGFRVKKVIAVPLEILRNSIVKHAQAEICSMSDCLAEAPPDWESRWDYNGACCYNSEAEALATIPLDESEKYELFAYRMLPVEFGAAGDRILRLPEEADKSLAAIAPEPDLASYAFIGYDIAGGPFPTPRYGNMLGFSCSPLSCNGMSSEHPVNHFWLIDQVEDAISIASEFGRTEPEPGPFFVYQVLRRRSHHWKG